MGSHAAPPRDFQWTTYEKPRAPPPLPSLPPWATPPQPQPPAASLATASISQQPSGDGGGAWRRPTSYFGAMKRLPMQAPLPQDPAEDADDEERRRYQISNNVPVQVPSVAPAPPPQHHSTQQIHGTESQDRREWLFGHAADPRVACAQTTTTNQREDDHNDDAHVNPTAVPPATKDQQPESDTGEAQDGPFIKPLAAEEAYFRPWKRTTTNDNNSSSDGDGGDDGEPSTVNKWKVRALLNPFAKRKPSQRPAAPAAPTSYEPEQQQPQDDSENPAAPSPTPVARTLVQRTPPPPPRQPSVNAAVKRVEPPPVESSLAPRPRTPTLAPAPVAMLPNQHESSLMAATPPPRRPSRGHIRSREAVMLPHLPPPACEPPRFEDNADLPVALANITDLRKSTAQLAPLEPPEFPQRARQDRSDVPVPRGRVLGGRNDDYDGHDESNSNDVSRVLKSVPPKPPTQLQQLKQQHKQHKQKAKKGATLDALKEIQRKRDERRNAQAEEKQRMKTELEQHGDDAGYKFRRLIQKYRDALPAPQRAKTVGGKLVREPSNQRLCVFVRKRPLAKKELKAKGYDILTCLYAAAQDKAKTLETSLRRELMCHEPKLKVDCSESLENHAFHFDGVFDDDQDNETVYSATVGPLVPFLVQGSSSTSGSASTATSLTVFAYGQTGSGKTYTMKSIYRQAAADLFARLAASQVGVAVGVSFYEIYMNQVNDLLNLRKRVQLMEDGDGVVQLLGLKEVAIASADELMELIAIGEEARATSANAVHDDSSRSHALLRVTISGADSGTVLARLSMVDLAGSERACDTQSDSKSTRMEGAEINKSLLALKECIRALDRGATHIPFRQSKLTQLLRDSFLCANSKTVMIATVSPCSDSCNHTLNTLRYADRLKEIGSS